MNLEKEEVQKYIKNYGGEINYFLTPFAVYFRSLLCIKKTYSYS